MYIYINLHVHIYMYVLSARSSSRRVYSAEYIRHDMLLLELDIHACTACAQVNSSSRSYIYTYLVICMLYIYIYIVIYIYIRMNACTACAQVNISSRRGGRSVRVRRYTYADVCWRMLSYADVCWHMLTYADVCRRMQTYADVCWRMLTYANVCWPVGSSCTVSGLIIGVALARKLKLKVLSLLALLVHKHENSSSRYSVYFLYWYISTNTDTWGAACQGVRKGWLQDTSGAHSPWHRDAEPLSGSLQVQNVAISSIHSATQVRKLSMRP